jgi:hypothetical protein
MSVATMNLIVGIASIAVGFWRVPGVKWPNGLDCWLFFMGGSNLTFALLLSVI